MIYMNDDKDEGKKEEEEKGRESCKYTLPLQLFPFVNEFYFK